MKKNILLLVLIGLIAGCTPASYTPDALKCAALIQQGLPKDACCKSGYTLQVQNYIHFECVPIPPPVVPQASQLPVSQSGAWKIISPSPVPSSSS